MIRVRVMRACYRLAWVALWLAAPLHRGHGRGVKAILTHEGRVLLVQHTYGPRRWELPGGGLRRRETPLEGIRREIREELSVELGDAALVAVGCGSGRQPRRAISVFTAEIEPANVRPDPVEIGRAQWHDPQRLPPRLGWQVSASLRALAAAAPSRPVALPR